ncbi:MAG TPA: hypothetical protein VF092_12620 [Longimicrobium sp.]
MTAATVPREGARREPGWLHCAWLFALLGAWMLIRPAHGWLEDWLLRASRPWWSDAVTWAIIIATLLLVSVPLVAAAIPWRTLGLVPRIVAAAMLLVYGVVAWPVAFDAVGWSVEFAAMEREANAMMIRPRKAMRVPPAEAAARALAAGDSAFLGVMGYALEAPIVENDCVLARFGVHPIEGTGDVLMTPNHARFQRQAGAYATRYNAALAARLGVSAAELQRDAPCDDWRRAGWWPPRER